MGGLFSPGRLFHYGVDFILVSMILAGVKLVTGFELKPERVGHTSDSISFVKKYLRFGEWLFQSVCNKAVKSSYFKRVDWREMSQSFSSNLLASSKRMMDDFQKSFDAATGVNPKVEELN